MKTIFFMIGSMQSGGAERVLSEITRDLAKDYVVTIILYYKREIFYSIDSKVRIIELENETRTKSIWRNALFLRNLVNREQPDLFVSFLVPFNIFNFYSLAGVNVPKVLCERNDPRYWSSNCIMKLMRYIAYRYADGVVFQTIQEYDYFSDKITNHGVIIPNLCFLNREKVGQALTVEKKKKIVTVSRIEAHKNLSMLIYAFAQLYPKYPDYCLKIYGEGKANERKKLQSLIQRLGVQKNVELCGAKKNILDEISDAHFFVMSSNHEGMSNAVMEAISLGLPVITTNVSGAVEMVKNGDNGYIVEVCDEGGLKNAMEKLIVSPLLCIEMGEKSVEISKQFNYDTIIKLWKEYFELMINRF